MGWREIPSQTPNGLWHASVTEPLRAEPSEARKRLPILPGEGALGFTGITSSWLGFTSLLSAHSTYYPWVLSSKHVFLRSCGHHSLQGSLRTLYLNIQTLHCWFQLVTPVPSLHPLREPLGLSLYILFSAPAFLRSFLYPRISFLLHQEANYHSSTESDSFPNQ